MHLTMLIAHPYLSVNLTTMLVMTTIFISKMEGLPPTSATKMIDYWLILCQLVPFDQVVLLTVKEYLREEDEEHKNDLALEKIEIRQQTVATKESAKVNVDNDTYPREAWTISEMMLSRAGSLTVLTMIGKAFIIFLFNYKYHFRAKSAATLCAICLHHLLCRCCKLLLFCITPCVVLCRGY